MMMATCSPPAPSKGRAENGGVDITLLGMGAVQEGRGGAGKRRRQTCMISCSLVFKVSSTRLIASSVSFWTSDCIL